MTIWTPEDQRERLRLRAVVESREFADLEREEQLGLRQRLHELTMRYTNFVLRRAE